MLRVRPIFENFNRRDISVAPLSDTSSGYLEAVASDSERASGGAKVPRQRRPIDFASFFLCQESKCVAETKQREAAGQKSRPSAALKLPLLEPPVSDQIGDTTPTRSCSGNIGGVASLPYITKIKNVMTESTRYGVTHQW